MTRSGGRGGGTYFPGPSPLCASGDKGGRVLPLTPLECKQQQMNKNKIQKARGSSQACPHPRVFAVATGGPLAAPLHHSCLHPRAAWHWPYPRASPGLRTAGPAAHTSDGRQALCWCAGLGGTSVWRGESPTRGTKSEGKRRKGKTDEKIMRGTGRKAGHRECGVTGRPSLGTHLGLGIGLQPKQTPHLQGFRLDDSSTHKVLRVGIHIVQKSRAKPQKLQQHGY